MKKITSDFDIMTKILNVRYTDLNEEKRLCLELLDFGEKRQNDYARTFAYVYLFDSVLALGEYHLCDEYLSQAVYLSRKHNYKNLLMTLCNFAGLYFIRLNDEQTAIQYFLDGLHIANELKDNKTSGMLYNNIGLGFAGRDDWETAKELFHKAYLSVYKQDSDNYEEKIISYLSNYAESCLQVNEVNQAKEALELCESFQSEELYYKIRIGCEWASYFAKTNQIDKCIDQAQMMLDLHIEEYNNKYFICDMIEDISRSLLTIKEYKLAKRFIDMLDELVSEAPSVIRYRAQCAKIHYLEAIEEDASEAYESYYYIDKEMVATENKVRLQSILSIIQLHEVLRQRDEIQLEKEVLENIIQIDELTGLYNRRYFNKLTTKIISNRNKKSLGIIMIDVDYFKQYNDVYGHFKGDEILKTIGELLKQYAIEGITPSRYGGDEFVCLCHNVTSQQVDQYVYNIYNALKQSQIEHKGTTYHPFVTLSIGYVFNDKQEDLSVAKLLSLADQALYYVKEQGRNNYYKQEI